MSTRTASGLDALALMSGMELEDGRTWGEAAHPFQRADAEAILRPAAPEALPSGNTDGPAPPRRHYLLRGRGMSKTTDLAALTLALLLAEAPPRARVHVYAVDHDQAALFIDAVAGIVGRTPGLGGALEVGARAITVKSSQATLSVEASDGASAYGTRPWLTVVDELAMWPATTNYRRLWGAIVSAVPKVPGSRLLVIGTAGSPTSMGAEVWGEARASEHWHTSRTPGPSPWWSPADIDSTRADLTASEWRRLILCEWAESDDALTSPEDVDAAIRGGSAVIDPHPGTEYVAALDVGTRRDLTALVVGHAERTDAGRRVVIDRALFWRPRDTGGRVDLAEVEAAVMRVCKAYRARLRFDRMQAEQLTGNLARAGIRTEEYVFSSAGANRLARSLFVALRDRALSLPDDSEVREEFMSTRMVETGPGTVKLQNPPGTHDDIVTAVGMVVSDLMDQPETGRGMVTVPRGRRDAVRLAERAMQRPTMPLDQRARIAARGGGYGPGGAVVLDGTANDPRRVRSGRWGR
ncbi:MAG: terminase large subunit domain-containing protein [Brachybacterium sp.]|uniref:terminase large subunit domain-containing protein n=1 Tax=Brachybacterium sp. TaxID=1891286 RepID=UPI003F938394